MEQIIFYILIFAILGLIGVVLMFLRAYLHLHGQLITLTRQNLYLKNQDAARIENILSQSHNEAIRIIEEANKKAGDLLTQARTIEQTGSQSLSDKLNEAARLNAEELKKASSDLLALYKEALKSIQTEEIQSAASISKGIIDSTNQQLGQFKDLLAKETIGSEKVIEAKVTKEYQAIEEELQAYKTRRLSEIDSHIFDIIQSVTEAILKKQLTVNDQQQHVYEALQKMKVQTKL